MASHRHPREVVELAHPLIKWGERTGVAVDGAVAGTSGRRGNAFVLIDWRYHDRKCCFIHAEVAVLVLGSNRDGVIEFYLLVFGRCTQPIAALTCVIW